MSTREFRGGLRLERKVELIGENSIASLNALQNLKSCSFVHL
jgi:hypothetical protein